MNIIEVATFSLDIYAILFWDECMHLQIIIDDR
jgi:hypothetical protein